MLALVPHPARVAEAGGVNTAAREAGAGPLARLGLGHLRVEGQVEEAIAQQPAVPVQQPGGGATAAAAARRPSPPQPGGRRLRGANAGPAPRFHLFRRPCPAGLRSRARTAMLQGGNSAGENRAAASAAASPPPHRRLPQSRSPVRRDRSQLPSPPFGSLQSHSGIASRSVDLVLSESSPPPRRPGPGRRWIAGGAGGAERSRGDLREGEGTPRAAPPRPRLAPTASAPAPRAREGGGPREPRGGRAQHGRGIREAGLSPAPPARRPAAPQQPSSLRCCQPGTRAAAGARGALGRLPPLARAHAPPHRPSAVVSPRPDRDRGLPRARPPGPARELRRDWPPRCGPRACSPLPVGARGRTRPHSHHAPPEPHQRKSRPGRLRSFSKKEALPGGRLQLQKCSAFPPRVSPSSAPSSCLFLLFFLRKTPTTHKELSMCSRQKS